MTLSPRTLTSPRVVGACLVAVSLIVGIVAGCLIPLAPWAILAACLLAVATVGMGVGVLWMLRASWAEKTWPPGGREVPAELRTRRLLRNLGIVLLAPLPLLAGGLAWSIAEGTLGWERIVIFGMFVTVYGAAGVWLLRASRSRAETGMPRDSHVQRPEHAASSPREDGWRSLGGPLRGTLPVTLFAPFAISLVVIPTQLFLIVDDTPWGVPVWGAALAVGIAVGLIFVRRARAPLEVHATKELVRLRGRTLPWAGLSRAELAADPPWPGAPRTLILGLGDDSNRRGRVILRRKEALELSDEETELLLRVIDRSTVELPRDKDDPRGRFSRQLYPNSLTKTDAAELVAHPPGMHEELPIATPL